MTSSPPLLERASKAAAVLSVAVIMLLFIWLHPDLTWQLRLAGMAAFAVGWFASRVGGGVAVQTICLLAAPLAPAALRAVSGREGPVLDLVWMAGLTASIIRGSTWTTWSMPAAWRLPAGAWIFTLALAWPIVALRELQFEPAGFFELGRVNGEAGLTAAHAVMWTCFVVWTSLMGLLWLDTTSERLGETPPTIPTPAHGLWIGGTIASIVALYQGLVDMQFANTAFWAEEARATGTMLDANAYGVVAALSGPLAFRALASSGRPLSLSLAVAVLLVNVGGVWLSGSRTAALCVVVGLVALAGSVSKSTATVRRLLPAALAGVVLTVLVVVVGGTATGPVRRLLELPDSPRAALSAVVNRGPYGTIAALMILEYPTAGVGPGSYNVIAPDYYRRLWGSGLPFDNAQNWWRQVVAEGGILGGTAPIVLSALVAWCVLRIPSAPGRRRDATIVRGLLLALGLASGIQAPTQAPIVMLWFATLAGWLPSLLSDSPPSRAWSQPWPRAAWTAGLGLALAFTAVQASLAVGSLDPAARARRTGREYVAGAYQAEALPESDTGHFNWTTGSARFEWPAKSPWLMVRFWTPHPDIEANPVRVTITTSCGPVFDEMVGTTEERSLGLRLPRDLRSLTAEVHVSRTWQPSSDGTSADTRRLGVALVVDFADRDEGLTPGRWVDLTSCRP